MPPSALPLPSKSSQRRRTRVAGLLPGALAVLAASFPLAACGGDAGNGIRDGVELGGGAAVTSPSPRRGIAWVIFGADTVHAEVARTEAQRQRGLMYRETLADGQGMLFVFDNVQLRSFWMRNTYLPLDIAFLDDSRRVVDIQQMEPLDENFTESRAPAMFALEVPRGWFQRQGVEVGAVAEIVFGPL